MTCDRKPFVDDRFHESCHNVGFVLLSRILSEAARTILPDPGVDPSRGLAELVRTGHRKRRGVSEDRA
jgi:hypothetical protein